MGDAGSDGLDAAPRKGAPYDSPARASAGGPLRLMREWTSMNRFVLFILLTLVPGVTLAQTEGRIGVGASTTINVTSDSSVGTGVGFGLLVRLNPKRGWGPAGAFNWYEADMVEPGRTTGAFARARIRPLMGGVSYNIVRGSVLTSFSVVGGPSFNGVRFDGNFPRSAVASISADTSIAVRPGVGITYTLGPRTALVGFGGYMINRPGIVYRDSTGAEFRDRWRADAVVLSIGAVYSVF